jgi:hypothetical protein
MPLGKQPDEILTFSIDVETRDAIQGIVQFQKASLKHLEGLTNAFEKFMKANMSEGKKAIKQNEELASGYGEVSDSVKNLDTVIGTLRAQQEKAGDAEKKILEEQIELLNKQRDTVLKVVKAKDALKGKDKGKPKKKSLADLMATAGGRAGSAGAGMKARGAMMGGAAGGAAMAGGAALAGVGASLKGISGLSKAVAPLLSTFSSLAPLVKAFSNGIMGIVQLMIDAEAQAKKFNKSILDSASTSEFLHGNLDDADAGAQDLADTMREVRDASYDVVFNAKWGLLAEDHAKVLNVLNQEGVSLYSIKQAAKTSGMEVGKFEQQLVATSVAFSRNFGVPLQEINQAQAEMVTELGMGLQQTSLAFTQISRAAYDSGMSTNKFFTMIRAASQDMALYNTRMEDTVGLLSKLGRAMSPRNAQKFMSTLTQGFKNMGRLDKLRLTLMAGPKKTKELFDKDMEQRERSLADSISATTGKSIDEVKKALAEFEGGKRGALTGMLKGHEGGGALLQAASETKMDKRAARKGTFGMAQGIGNMGITAQLGMMKAAIGRFSKAPGGSLEDMVSEIGPEMAAENLGITQEQLRGMTMLEGVMSDTRDEMRASGQYTEDQLKDDDLVLKYAGTDAKKAKEALMTEKDFAQKQTNLTDDIGKKLDRLMEWFMNTLYGVLVDIWEGIEDIWSILPWGGAGKTKKLQIQMARLGNKDLLQVVKDSGDDVHKARDAAFETKGGKEFLASLAVTKDSVDALEKKEADIAAHMQKPRTEEEEKNWPNVLKQLEKDKAEAHKDAVELRKKMEAANQAIDLQTKERGFGSLQDAVEKYINESGKTGNEAIAVQEKMYKAIEAFNSGVPMSQALEQAGFTSGEASGLKQNMARWFMDPEHSITAIAGYQKNAGGAPAAEPTASAASPSATAAAPTAPAAAAAPVAPAATPVATPTPAKAPATAATAEKSLEVAQDMKDGLSDIENKLKSVKIDKSFLRGDYQKSIEAGALSAVQQALFEYYMYSQLGDKDKLKDYMKGGGTGAAGFLSQMQEGVTPAKGNAAGGVVAGVGGGLATVRAAAGEGLASVGAGERIVPAGGGGGSPISISVNGVGGNDLAKVIHAKVVDGIAEYKRREKFN